MTSKERVLTAVAHETPDRIPIDFGGHRSSGIAAIAYAKLKQALGITSGDIYVYDMIQQLAIVEPDVLDAVGADTIELGRGFCLEERDWKPWRLPDGTPCKVPAFINLEERGGDTYLLSDDGIDLGVQKAGCLYFEQVYWPWLDRDIASQDFSDLEDALAHNMWTAIPAPGGHIPLDDEGLKQLADGARKLRATTDRAIIGLFGGNLFEVPTFLYRIDTYLMHMGLESDACARLSSVLCDLYMANLEKWLTAVGPYIDSVLFGDDLGGQTGPLMSPDMYRKLYKPYHREMWTRVKELAPHVKIQLHSCGGIEPLLSDLADAGLDIVNPVQITCRGMDAQALKQKHGTRLTLWGGGCDTREVLPHGTPEQVRNHVREQAQILGAGGGFVFQQVHNILADVPPANIVAMFDELRTCRT